MLFNRGRQQLVAAEPNTHCEYKCVLDTFCGSLEPEHYGSNVLYNGHDGNNEQACTGLYMHVPPDPALPLGSHLLWTRPDRQHGPGSREQNERCTCGPAVGKRGPPPKTGHCGVQCGDAPRRRVYKCKGYKRKLMARRPSAWRCIYDKYTGWAPRAFGASTASNAVPPQRAPASGGAPSTWRAVSARPMAPSAGSPQARRRPRR